MPTLLLSVQMTQKTVRINTRKLKTLWTFWKTNALKPDQIWWEQHLNTWMQMTFPFLSEHVKSSDRKMWRTEWAWRENTAHCGSTCTVIMWRQPKLLQSPKKQTRDKNTLTVELLSEKNHKDTSLSHSGQHASLWAALQLQSFILITCGSSTSACQLLSELFFSQRTL